MSGEEIRNLDTLVAQNSFKQWEVELYVQKTIEQLKLKHHPDLKILRR